MSLHVSFFNSYIVHAKKGWVCMFGSHHVLLNFKQNLNSDNLSTNNVFAFSKICVIYLLGQRES